MKNKLNFILLIVFAGSYTNAAVAQRYSERVGNVYALNTNNSPRYAPIAFGYPSEREAPDTLNTSKIKNAGPSITMSVDYDFIILDTFVFTYLNETPLRAGSTKKNPVQYPVGSVLTIHSNGINGALESIYVKLNNAPEYRYTTPVSLPGKGKHTVQVRAVDQYGNETISAPLHIEVLGF